MIVFARAWFAASLRPANRLPALVFALCSGCATLPAKQAGNAFRVMSYNIEYGHEGLDSVAAVIRDQHADIVGLQEVDVHWSARSNFVDQAEMLAKKTGMNYRFARIYAIPNADPSKQIREFGVALLTRYPIISFSNHDITRLSTQDSAATPTLMPGLLDARVNVNGRQMRVFNVHLDYRTDPSVRAKQVAEIISYIDRDTVATILTGDLNASPNAPELAPLMNRLHETWNNTGLQQFTFASRKLEKRIDYILQTGNFCVVKAFIPAVYASDHLPMVVDLDPDRRC